ncbi:Bug family tripartite tricarboxylate transporter substrate binding protein [Ramlibacter rhizophilus]|uniref:Tripartite tricarboxylate transporter substrate binding protein n=1 Tax=Ramlibacter rhizophilus TaxID=1781167 RepID=A0A4Z0BH34_9BURK|nr:tripartite tricarboxylate transporter substrate binding protein [Ramlibacter rhizophilus]TFY98602.1 tripartite tricarboxylate transporter substrate binding protein [Ramlibacter rhizophilus]
MIRKLATLLLAALTLSALPLAAQAQKYPGGPVTVVIPLAAGDGGDTALRAMAEALQKQLDAPFLVNNRPGAGGSLGVQNVLAAKKDGYTLLFAQNSPLTIRRVMEPETVNYDPQKDLIPLGLTTRTPSLLVVRKEAPYNTFQELVAHAKKSPRSVRIGHPGAGSSGDLSVQLINTQAGIELLAVPYKGAAPAVTDALGGQIDGVILALGAVSAHMKSGAFKPIAISSAYPALPDVPTLAKLGYKQDLMGIWFGFYAPAGTPSEVVQTLVPALQKVAEDGAIASRLLPLGIVQEWEPPARLAEAIRTEYEAVGDLNKRLQKK